MCAPSPPPAPDYTGAAQAQGEANVEAARVQGQINNPNVYNPYGTQTVTWGNFDQSGYDQAMQQYQQDLANWNQLQQSGTGGLFTTLNPRPVAPDRSSYMQYQDTPTITQTFSPQQQALFDQQMQLKQMLGGVGLQGAGSLGDIIGKSVDFSGAPAMPGDYGQLRQQAVNELMSRPTEDYGRAVDQAQSDLIAAGIRPGTKAYADKMALLQRGLTDAQMQAGVNARSVATQAYQTDMDRRKQFITELLAQRQVPLNEITALMSGSQVSNPFAIPTYAQNAQVAPSPVFGATQLAGQYGTDVWNAQQAQQANLMNGLFGLGGAGMMAYAMSDRRLKSDVRRIGTHSLGIPLYEYTIGGHREIGVMADEVASVKPEAVAQLPNGYWMVNYGMIGRA